MTARRGAALLIASTLVASGLALGGRTSARADDDGPAGDPTISMNNLRDGWDADEPDLLPANVTASDFGPLFTTPVHGQVYAQPLVVKQSEDSTGTLVVATEDDAVYGMNPVSGSIEWTDQLGTAWASSVLGCGDLEPDIGVTSTPVYDPSSNTVYVMAKVAPDGATSTDPIWQLHALDASTGAERTGWPVTIGGHPDNDPGETFDSETEAQRPGLLLLDGVVYAGFASYCDHKPYNGYVVGVSTSTATQTAMFTTEEGTNDGEGGIWQSGGGLVSDGPGQIILATGNGDVSPEPPSETPPASLEEAVVRLTVQPDGTLKATDWFSPDSRQTLDENDTDLGAGGPMAVPDGYGTTAYPHLLVQDGKDGHVYLLNRDLLGGLGQGPDGGDDALGVTGPYNGEWGHPAFWGGPDGSFVYTVEASGYLRALQLTADAGGVPSLTSVATSAATLGYTSGSPIVTSDGGDSPALVWVVNVIGSSGRDPALNAYSAQPDNGVLDKVYSAPLYPPGVTDGNDAHGPKFATVATSDGRVYVGTRDGDVFGFGHPSTAPLNASPTDFGNVPVGNNSTLPVTLTATRPIKVTSADASGAFTVALPDGTKLPTNLSTARTLTVDVTFSPSAPGPQSENLVLGTSESGHAGNVTFDLDGYGTQPGLTASPTSVEFGQVPVGSVNTSGINIVNTSGSEETFTVEPSGLAAPFSAGNLPAPDTAIQAGASLAIPLTYAPTAASAGDEATLTVDVDGAAPLSVPITGSAVVGAPLLTLTPARLDFGLVARGHSRTLSFKIENTGTTTLTLEKAAPPSGEFTSANPVSEGSKILPDQAIVQRVTFRPTKSGTSRAVYLITGDDGRGHQAETLTGADDAIADWYTRHDAKAFLGPPTGPEHATAGGETRSYRHGRLYWSTTTGVHVVTAPILHRYLAVGGPAGHAGFPTSNVVTLAAGKRSRFSHGWSICWSRATGAWAVWGEVAKKWESLGGQHGRLGYPTGDTHRIKGGLRGRFRYGSITWRKAHGYIVHVLPH